MSSSCRRLPFPALLFAVLVLAIALLTTATAAPAATKSAAAKSTKKVAKKKAAKSAAKKSTKKSTKKATKKKAKKAPKAKVTCPTPAATAAKVRSTRRPAKKTAKKTTTKAVKKSVKKTTTPKVTLRSTCSASKPADGATTAPGTGTSAKPAAGTTSAQPSAGLPGAHGTPAAGRLAVGLNANTKAWGADAGFVMDKSAFLGTGWLREEIEWAQIETRPGHWDWTRYDQLFTAAAQHGQQVLALLTGPPAWAAPDPNALPTDPAEYGRFVARVVSRYGTNGSFWAEHPELPKIPAEWFELWNEPYFEYFSSGGIDPAKYAQMVRAGTAAGRAADPTAKFMLEATPYELGLDRPWTDALYAAMPDLNNWFDAVAVHAYGTDLGSAGAQWRRTIEGVRAQLVAHGAADKPMWVTEMGWSTCPGTNPDCTSEARQATLTAQALNLIKTTYSSYVRGVMLYHFMDQFGERRADDSQPFYGFVRNDWTPKPAAQVLQDFTASLR